MLGNEPPQRGAQARADREHHGVHSERASAFGAREGVGDDGQAGSEDQRAAQSLEGPGDDEHQERARGSAQRRAEREEGETGHPDGLASDEIREASERQEGPGDHHEIDDDHPLDGPADRRAKRARDRRQADVDDRGVERGHEGADSDERQHGPLVIPPQGSGPRLRRGLSLGAVFRIERHDVLRAHHRLATCWPRLSSSHATWLAPS